MSDRYQGSAFRGGGRGPPREDRRYAPRHAYADTRGYDARDSYASSYYPERGYPEARPRKIHRAIPPPRPWDYSRRQPPRNEQERIELEREREAWEAKEEERYRQRMEERERERERDRERGGPVHHGGWDYDAEERMYRGGPPEGYDRERARHADHGPPRRPRSRSPPGMDPRYEQRGSWRRTSIGSAEGRERDDRSAVASHVERAEPSHGYHARRSPPPSAPSAAAGAPPAAAHLDTPDAPRFRPAPGAAADLRDADMRATPRGSAYRPNETGFLSTPPTGPRASRGPAMASPAFRREGSGSTGPYTPASERDAFLSPVSSRFPRSARDAPPGSAYRGGHPSFGRGRRDTNPYDHVDDDGYRTHHAGSSPHEASPYSPSTSTQGNAHLTARLSRTSSSQTPTTPAPAVPLPPSSMALLCPELEAELQTIAGQRSAFTSTWMLGAKRTALRAMRAELNAAHLDLMAATSRRQAADRALDAARDSADAYSLEENRKEQLQHLMAQQLQQPPATQTA